MHKIGIYTVFVTFTGLKLEITTVYTGGQWMAYALDWPT